MTSPPHGSDPHDDPVPHHVAIIMDGNGRWASERGLPRHAGHREGMNAVREAIEGAVELGVGILTLFAFSTENWQRPREEITALMTLLKLYADSECDKLREQGVEVRVLGDVTRMEDEAREAVRHIQDATRGGRAMRLNLMISYSGRDELLNAAQSLARRVDAGELSPDDIDADVLEDALYTRGLPDPDLLVRTSGEFRISNFMLWQLAYTEIHISPVLWPDFSRKDLLEAIRDYQRRERRFGRIDAG